MKRYIFILITLLGISLTSCTRILDRELFKQVDYFVEQLDTRYDHYDMFGGSKEYVKTIRQSYSVAPMGRLIIIKIDDYVPSTEYEKLQKAFHRHYRGDRRVNDVYINQGGTLVIDCRIDNPFYEKDNIILCCCSLLRSLYKKPALYRKD